MDEITEQIATQLQEPNTQLIARLVQQIGSEAALTFLQQTIEIEAQGGILTSNKKRRRTPGGAFFYLVKGAISKQDRRAVFPQQKKAKKAQKEEPQKPLAPPFTWDDRLEILPHVLEKKGTAMTVKMTLIGRPARATRHEDVVVTAMVNDKAPSLPKGLPLPPAKPTTYVVYIAAKQWMKVAEALKNPEDVLIVEGYPTFDDRIPSIAVFATNVTTKLLQQVKRAEQAKPAGGRD